MCISKNGTFSELLNMPFWQEFLPLKTVDIKFLCFLHTKMHVNLFLWQVLAEMAEIFGRFYFPAWQKFLPKNFCTRTTVHTYFVTRTQRQSFFEKKLFIITQQFLSKKQWTQCTHILCTRLSVATKNFILLITACRICTRLSVVPCSRLAFPKNCDSHC